MFPGTLKLNITESDALSDATSWEGAQKLYKLSLSAALCEQAGRGPE